MPQQKTLYATAKDQRSPIAATKTWLGQMNKNKLIFKINTFLKDLSQHHACIPITDKGLNGDTVIIDGPRDTVESERGVCC